MGEEKKTTGSHAILNTLVAEGVDTVFGYPGGAIMPLYDALYDYTDKIRHILVRHEQAAVHAAQGYARATGRTGVCFVTSGPGATNTVTGIADAMLDSTPLVVITGQVASPLLGIDSFQETNIVGITHPITKWNTLVRRAEDVAGAIARAIYIARSGRPGPVLVDITKDAQVGLAEWLGYTPCEKIRSYNPYPKIDKIKVAKAAELIDEAKKPMVLFGQGVTISGAEQELKAFLEKSGIPAASTLLGLSALDVEDPHYIGMIGMHGNYAPNITNQECDLILAVGMRFDDRVTCDTSSFAKNANVIHIDIDPAEIDKIITAKVGIVGDAKGVLAALTKQIERGEHTAWLEKMHEYNRYEKERLAANSSAHKCGVVTPHCAGCKKDITILEAISKVGAAYEGKNITVTDVGQHQMVAARSMPFAAQRSMITSGGLGTMGFGLPAAMGAKVGAPERDVVLFVGDGGIQMNIQEFATIMQENISVKVVLLNNNFLGMVRQWQQLFFDRRYSSTPMVNPAFEYIAKANDIEYGVAETSADLDEAIAKMKSSKGSYLLEVKIKCEDNVLPMVAPGRSLSEITFND